MKKSLLLLTLLSLNLQSESFILKTNSNLTSYINVEEKVDDIIEVIKEEMKIEKEEEFTISFSHLNISQIKTLSSSFDLSKSYIEVISVTEGSLCYWPDAPYNSCVFYLNNLMPMLKFNNSNSVIVQNGLFVGGWYSNYLRSLSNSTITFKVVEVSGGSVVSGVSTINRNSNKNISLTGSKDNSALFSSYRSGAGYDWDAKPYNNPTAHYSFSPTITLSSYDNINISTPYVSGSKGEVPSEISWFILTEND
jgi:hypothetical protein